jgi:ESCRT-II complex subunit VPS25
MATKNEPATVYTPVPHYHFPPFFTLQRNLTTRSSQITVWSSHILSYCAHHRLYTFTLTPALGTPLFSNPPIKRALSERDARSVLDVMATADGGSRVEWLGTGNSRFRVWWRRPEEWAGMIEEWVDKSGQKGVVLTLYELTEGEQTTREEWYGMDKEVVKRVVGISVKRGKAAMFGGDGEEGVKFF